MKMMEGRKVKKQYTYNADSKTPPQAFGRLYHVISLRIATGYVCLFAAIVM